MIDFSFQLAMVVVGVLAATPEWREVYPMLTDGNIERIEAQERRWLARLSGLR